MNLNYLKALVASAKGSEHLYEEQAAAMEFTLAFGEQLIAAVEAARDSFPDLDSRYYTTEVLKKALATLEVRGEVLRRE